MSDYKKMVEEHACNPPGCEPMARCMCALADNMANEIERLQGIIDYQESRLSVIGHLASRNDESRVARLEAAIELIVQESNAMKQLKMATDALGRAVK